MEPSGRHVKTGAAEGKAFHGRAHDNQQGLGRLFSTETPLGASSCLVEGDEFRLGAGTGSMEWNGDSLFPASSSVCLPQVNDQTRNLATPAWHLAQPSHHPPGTSTGFPANQKLEELWRAQILGPWRPEEQQGPGPVESTE